MSIGCLGGVLFAVDSNTVRTIQDLKMRKTVQFGTHKLAGRKALLEFTGVDPDEFTFSIELSAHLGVNPQKELDKLTDIAETGTVVSFVLGTRVYGQAGWVITNLSVEVGHIFKDGALVSMKVSLTIKEYAAR